jgi:hypothetical protein
VKKYLLAFLILGSAAVCHAQGKYLLRIHLAPGQVLKYATSVNTGTMDIGMTMAMKCVSAAKKQFTVNTTMGSMTMNKQPMPAQAAAMMKQMLVITVMNERGVVISNKVTGIPGMNSGGSQAASVPLPEKPVGVGDSWTGVGEYNGQKLPTSYKVTGLKKVGGKTALVLSSTVNNPSLKLDKPVVTVLDVSTGLPFSVEMSGTVVRGTSKQPMKMVMKRI